MKKIVLLSICFLSIISCSDNKNESNLHLTGNVEGLSQGKLYIQKIQDTTLVTLDSIDIKGDSKFESFLNITEPEVLYLSLNRGRSNSIDNDLHFFAEPGKMNIETTLKEFYAKAKITGSKNQDLWEEFKTINSEFNNKNLILIETQLKKGFEKTANKTSQDSLDNAFQKLKIQKYRYTANFAATHGDFEIAPYLTITEISDINIAYLDTIQKHLSPKITKSKYGKMLKEHIKERKMAE